MKRLFFVMMAVVMSVGIFAQSSNDKILGKWTNEDSSRIIEFVKNGATYEAIIRKAENQSVVGKKQITGLKPNGEKDYKDGVIHIIQKNETVACKAKLEGNNKLEIKASKGMFSKSQVWTKLQ